MQKSVFGSEKPRNKMKKSQSTVEFVVLMSFMFLVLAGFVLLLGNKLVQLKTEKNQEIAVQLREIVFNEIKLAKVVEDGYFRQFRLPYTMNSINYQIKIENDTELWIFVGNEGLFKHIPENVSGNISKGWNNVTKINGVIRFVPK